MKKLTLILALFISLFSNAQSRSTESFLSDVSVIELSASGNIWIGSLSSGCDGFTAGSGTWAHFNSGNSTMVSDTVTSISLYLISNIAHSFMGTTHGVAYKHGLAWDTLAMLVHPNVIDMVRSAVDHRFYVATQGGLSVYNDTTLQHLADYTASATTLPSANITCLNSKPLINAGFFFGTADSGYFYSPDAVNFTQRTVANAGLSDNRITCIFAKPSGGAEWVGTKNGYNECVSGTCTAFTAGVNSIHQNDISALDADFRGHAWVGTRDSGVAIYNHTNASWQYLTTADGLPSNRITAINCKATGSGECFIGTADGGTVIVDSLFTVQQLPTAINTVDKEQMNVLVFPQPASDLINFYTATEIKTGEIALYDISGKLVVQQKLNNTSAAALSVKNMETGFYLYTIRNENALVKTGKVSIVR